MLLAVLLTLLCSAVGSHDYRLMTQEELRDMIDNLHTSAPDEILYTRNSGSMYTTEVDASEYSSSESSIDSSEEPDSEWYVTTVDPSYDIVTENEPEETSEDCADPEHQAHPDGYSDGEDHYPMQVGSMRGIPGVNYPDYSDIPLTPFQCADKAFIPGFYADLETGCQVFHVCWPHRRESFLCPVGTTFNQAILACDHWYSTNCSLAPHYYDVNAESSDVGVHLKKEVGIGSMIDSLLEKGQYHQPEATSEDPSTYDPEQPRPVDASYLMKFLPVKAKVVVFPETAHSKAKIVAEASMGHTKRKVFKSTMVPVTEDIETEYMPPHPKQTPVPVQPMPEHAVFAKVKPASLHHDSSVEKIIDQVFEIAKRIVKESQGLVPAFESLAASNKARPVSKFVTKPVAAWEPHKVKPQAHMKHIPLTKLDPRFITKPVYVMEHPKAEALKVSGHPKFHSRIHHARKPITKSSRHRLYVSPITKQSLSRNYLKLLKIKHG